jgi:hypothetical protein
MKISELIADLQALLQQAGDLDGVKYGSAGWVYIPAEQFDDEDAQGSERWDREEE